MAIARDSGSDRLRDGRRVGTFRPTRQDELERQLRNDLTQLPGSERQRGEYDDRVQQPRTKLDRAKVVYENTRKELEGLNAGLEEQLAQIGMRIEDAYRFKGREKAMVWFGQALGIKDLVERAQQRRIDRLHEQDLDDLTRGINEHIRITIERLGSTETEYKEDVTEYNASLKRTIDRYQDAQPRYEAARTEKERLKIEMEAARQNLEAGLVSETERPQAEAKLEELRRLHHDAELEETDQLEIIRICQQALPTVQKDRDAANQAIVAIHQMRRSLLEKQLNLGVIFERAMTAVRARVEIERYNATDPAMNKAISEVTKHNLAVAGAAVEVLAKRLQKDVIDPADAVKLVQELTDHLNQFAAALSESEGKVEKGYRPVIAALTKESETGYDEDSEGGEDPTSGNGLDRSL